MLKFLEKSLTFSIKTVLLEIKIHRILPDFSESLFHKIIMKLRKNIAWKTFREIYYSSRKKLLSRIFCACGENSQILPHDFSCKNSVKWAWNQRYSRFTNKTKILKLKIHIFRLKLRSHGLDIVFSISIRDLESVEKPAMFAEV